ncbi:MAG: phosphatase PAP2 family protein [Mycoplasmataceae bacterium]|nr:phosphatase PAP2 family protein [Mycoplasmataceae bacterium]
MKIHIKKQTSFNKNNNGVFKLTKRATWIACGIVLGVICVLMTIAAFCDYQIDYILAKPALPTPRWDGSAKETLGFIYTNDVIGRIVEIIGTGPCIIATVAALVIFHQNAYRIVRKGLRLTVQIGTIAVALMWVIYACFFQFFPLLIVSTVGVTDYGKISPLDSYGNINNGYTALLYLVFGAVMGGLIIGPCWLIIRRINKQTIAELLRYAFILTSASIIAILLVEIAIKPTLQRERFRFLYAYNGVSMTMNPKSAMWTSDPQHLIGGSNDPYGGFHNWYALPITPYGYGAPGNLPFISEDASKSFPSGHETMAAVGFYSLVCLPFTCKQCSGKKVRIALFVTAILGSAIVGFYRIRAGAHYLSDVTIGTLLAVGLLFIFHMYYCYGCSYLDKWCNLKINANRRNI